MYFGEIILHAEREDVVANLVAKFFKQKKVEIDRAKNYKEALAALQCQTRFQGNYTGLITCFELNENKNGIDLIREAKAQGLDSEKFPVILLSGGDITSIRERNIAEFPRVKYLQKPFNGDELVEAYFLARDRLVL